MRPAVPMVALAAACVAAAVLAEGRADRVPPAIPAGPAQFCVSLTQLRDARVRDDRTIDFVTHGGRNASGFRVTLPQGCPDLGFEGRFAYETSLSQLCSTDIITVLRTAPVMRGASCGLGPFQPVTFPAATRPAR